MSVRVNLWPRDGDCVKDVQGLAGVGVSALALQRPTARKQPDPALVRSTAGMRPDKVRNQQSAISNQQSAVSSHNLKPKKNTFS